ncbi:DUF1992 domain-containing protein [Mycena sanguinolenta]|uniref:DUF1992 domain-containing protein n=1 Tax=Mycena sanguinolenta TaxID=230812 RepID=A0A8H6YHE2_9AGAR|nr:DUF1992 domain-containing protein [Mycena sanguinolenta]
MLHQVVRLSSCRPRFSTSAILRRPANGHKNGSLTGSAKLFADAAREEAELDTQSSRRVLEPREEFNWTGDERIEDTVGNNVEQRSILIYSQVLRMLVDKYKPLRTGKIQTAEQKLRKFPPRVQEYHPDSVNPIPQPIPPPISSWNGHSPGGSWADVPLLKGSPDHRPWHTEFKVPEHAKSSVKFGNFSLPSHTPQAKHAGDLEQTRKTEKEFNKQLGRIISARESTLDYRLGLGPHARRTGTRVNPVNIKGWTSLIEDRIEVPPFFHYRYVIMLIPNSKPAAPVSFAKVKGRGKPIIRTVEESNPFIAREEFLMNRIVKRNGAAPPWVQLQGELDASLGTFRALLLSGWTRHAVRVITLHGVHTVNPDALKAFRDPAWAVREANYHAAALAEVNERVRQYNALAPYAVRRSLYVLEAELAATYERAGDDVVREVAERAKVKETAVGVKHSDRQAGPYEGPDWSWLRRVGKMLVVVGRRLASFMRLGTR